MRFHEKSHQAFIYSKSKTNTYLFYFPTDFLHHNTDTWSRIPLKNNPCIIGWQLYSLRIIGEFWVEPKKPLSALENPSIPPRFPTNICPFWAWPIFFIAAKIVMMLSKRWSWLWSMIQIIRLFTLPWEMCMRLCWILTGKKSKLNSFIKIARSRLKMNDFIQRVKIPPLIFTL